MKSFAAALLLLGFSVEAAAPRALGEKDLVLVACQYPVAKAAKDALAPSKARVVDVDEKVQLAVALSMKPTLILLCDTSGVSDDLISVRKDKRFSAVPVVLITWGTERTSDLKVAAGASEVVKAPFNAAELNAAVSRTLGGAKPAEKDEKK